MKTYNLKSIVIDSVRYTYFYRREKNDRNGNPRFRVYILDPDGGGVYEKTFSTYDLPETLKNYLENCFEGDLKNV